MPKFGFQFLDINFTESQQQLGKDEPGCNKAYKAMNIRFDWSQQSNLGKQQICQSPNQHGQRQSPILEKLDHNYSKRMDLAGWIRVIKHDGPISINTEIKSVQMFNNK